MSKTNVIPAKTDWMSWKLEDIKQVETTVSKILEDQTKFTLALKEKDLNFKNIMHKGEVISAEVSELAGYIWCFINLSKDEKIREEARNVELKLDKMIREFSYNQELYDVFKEYFAKYKKEKLTEEKIKIVEDTNKGFIKMGLGLDKKAKKVLMDRQGKISKLASDFEKLATANYGKGIYFKKEELFGVPENIIANFRFDDKKKKYFVSIRPSEMSNIVKFCSVEDTRKKITELSGFGVGDVNTKKFSEILLRRSEITKILGFKTYSEMALSEEMVSRPEDVEKFLKNLVKVINPMFMKDKKEELNILKKHDKKIKKLSTWNWAYASNLAKEQDIGVKEEEYKPYFELENCLQVLFSIWKKIFDVNTTEVKGYNFFDESSRFYKFENTKTKELLGTGVFDLFPRVGKYGHACMNDITKGYTDLEGNRQANLIFLICNFMKNKDGKTLLSFSDVTTLFHEGGHFLHFLLMRNNYMSSGSVSNDFVEIPSQFHENFLQDMDFVKKNFKHSSTGKIMPKHLLSNIRKMNKKGEAATWVVQSMYSLYDQEIHGKNISKYSKNFKLLDSLYENMSSKYVNVVPTKNRHFASRFTHLTGGYQAKYYSYVVSRVYAQDFWEKFSYGGIKRTKVTDKYKKLLESGGIKKEMHLVKEFLGKPVNMKSFIKYLSN